MGRGVLHWKEEGLSHCLSGDSSLPDGLRGSLFTFLISPHSHSTGLLHHLHSPKTCAGNGSVGE